MTGAKKNPADPQTPEMSLLYLGLLHKGPNWTPEDGEEIRRQQRQHLALLFRLRDEGILLLSGPIPEGDPLRGIVALQADSIEQVRGYFQGDAHLESGRLNLEIHPWLVSKEAVSRLQPRGS